MCRELYIYNMYIYIYTYYTDDLMNLMSMFSHVQPSPVASTAGLLEELGTSFRAEPMDVRI